MALRRVGETTMPIISLRKQVDKETTMPIISLRKQVDKETDEANYQLCIDMEFWDCLLEALSDQPDTAFDALATAFDALATALDNMIGAIQKARDGENIKTG